MIFHFLPKRAQPLTSMLYRLLSDEDETFDLINDSILTKKTSSQKSFGVRSFLRKWVKQNIKRDEIEVKIEDGGCSIYLRVILFLRDFNYL